MQANNHIFSLKVFFILSCLFILQLSAFEVVSAAPGTVGLGVSQTSDELTCTLYRIVTTLSGPMGKAIATIAIIALGIGLFMGKLSWGLAVATAVGIAMIFGADSIVTWLSADKFRGDIVCDGLRR